MLVHGLDPANAGAYRDAAEGFVHYLHGVNPNGMTYLSNLSALGAERSVPELYHGWFADGTPWDSVECVRAASPSTTATDAGAPAAIVFYVVRSPNGCGAHAGADSSGTPRTWPACP
jgi:hypothetical protein